MIQLRNLGSSQSFLQNFIGKMCAKNEFVAVLIGHI